MTNTGYIFLEAEGLNPASEQAQTIPGIFSRASSAINTGKPVWVTDISGYTPIPVYGRFSSTTSIVMNAAGFTITITSADSVTVSA